MQYRFASVEVACRVFEQPVQWPWLLAWLRPGASERSEAWPPAADVVVVLGPVFPQVVAE